MLKVVPISMRQKACSFFGFATCALATLSMKRHGGARIFTGGIPLKEIVGVSHHLLLKY